MRKFVAGVLVGIIMSSAVAVWGNQGKMIQIYEGVKKIVVNREEVILEPNTPVFLYNNSVYAPVSKIADAMNLSTYLDTNTSTVYVGDRYQEAIGYWGREVKEMESNKSYSSKITYAYKDQAKSGIDNTGKSYGNYLMFDGHGGLEISFATNSEYTAFKGIVGFVKDGDTYPVAGYVNTNIDVYGDGQLIYSTKIKKGDYPKEVEIDLSGVNKLTIQAVPESSISVSRKVGIFEGKFMKK